MIFALGRKFFIPLILFLYVMEEVIYRSPSKILTKEQKDNTIHLHYYDSDKDRSIDIELTGLFITIKTRNNVVYEGYLTGKQHITLTRLLSSIHNYSSFMSFYYHSLRDIKSNYDKIENMVNTIIDEVKTHPDFQPEIKTRLHRYLYQCAIEFLKKRAKV